MEQLDKILKGCIAGDRREQNALYRHFAAKMYGVCLRYSKDSTEAEDILQEGFIKVFQHLSNFKNEGSLEGWIRRIMINTALERFRKKNPLYPVGEIYEYARSMKTEEIESLLSAEELLTLVRNLSPGYQMVFNLYVIEGYSHKEIGAKLGISEGTSKSQLARARGVLQEEIAKLYRVVLPERKNVG